MGRSLFAAWLRLRTWWATRLGLWRGRWQRAELQARVARWTWWPWPLGQAATWSYAVYHPAGLRDEQPAPLVLLLHGCGQHAMGFAQASGWVRAADRLRFRLLCPEQRDGANPWRCWNWFHPPAQAGHGEQDVVLQALDQAQSSFTSTRVAVVGLSSGGGLAALLAFHHAARFDAAVTVAAPPLLGRAPLQDPRQVMKQGLAIRPALAAHGLSDCAPLLVLQGDADEVVAPCCAEQLAEQALAVMQRAQPGLQATDQADGQAWHDAAQQVRLRRRLLPGLGHAWTGAPGGHPHVQRDGPPLTELALEFLRQRGVLAG